MNKFLQPSSLAGYGVILSVLNQIIDVNEFGAVGDAMVTTAQGGGGVTAILIAAIMAGIGAVLKNEKGQKSNGEKE